MLVAEFILFSCQDVITPKGRKNRAGCVALGEHVLPMHKALDSVSSTKRKRMASKDRGKSELYS